MIDIEQLKKYYIQDKIVLTAHTLNRCRERNIKQDDIRECIFSGEIIEQYQDDFPFPSCLIYGHATDNKVMHVVASDSGECSNIITAYYPNTDIFMEDLKTRRKDDES